MIKTYTFKNNNNTKNTFSFPNKFINYSKILDDIITTDVIKKNNYLFANAHFGNGDSKIIDIDDDFTKAAKFLANYKKNKSIKLPFIYGKMYTLSNGTPVVFYDDEIQIGFDTYSYNDFNDFSFLNNLSESTKKTIIKIYLNGSDAKININLK